MIPHQTPFRLVVGLTLPSYEVVNERPGPALQCVTDRLRPEKFRKVFRNALLGSRSVVATAQLNPRRQPMARVQSGNRVAPAIVGTFLFAARFTALERPNLRFVYAEGHQTGNDVRGQLGPTTIENRMSGAGRCRRRTLIRVPRRAPQPRLAPVRPWNSAQATKWRFPLGRAADAVLSSGDPRRSQTSQARA